MIISFNNIVSLLVTFIFITTSFAQTKSDLVKAIRKDFQLMNKDTGLKKVKLENEALLTDMPDGGGELVGYFKSGQIRKISKWIVLSHGNEITEFYFRNGQLIFVYEKFNAFLFTQKKEQLDHTKTETTFEGRYYFHNKKLFDYITTGHNRFEDDTINPERTLLKEANDNVKLLSKKK